METNNFIMKQMQTTLEENMAESNNSFSLQKSDTLEEMRELLNQYFQGNKEIITKSKIDREVYDELRNWRTEEDLDPFKAEFNRQTAEYSNNQYFCEVVDWLEENHIEYEFLTIIFEPFKTKTYNIRVFGMCLDLDANICFKGGKKPYSYPLEKLKKKILEMEDELIEDLKSREWQWLK